jgi:hypothetical protein
MPTIRDWTYVTVVALLLATYGVSTLAQSIAANAAEKEGSVCMISARTPG